MSLTPKQRVQSQIRHQETDHVPYTIGFEGDVAERLDAHYGSAAWRRLIDNAIRHVPGARLVVDERAGSHYTDLYGSTWRVDRRPFHLLEPALKEPSLAGYRFPDLDACFAPGWHEEAQRAIEAQQEHFLVAGFGFGLFERTWTLPANPAFTMSWSSRSPSTNWLSSNASSSCRSTASCSATIGAISGACCWGPSAGGALSSRAWPACTTASTRRAGTR